MFLAWAKRMVRTGATVVLEKIWGQYEMGYKQAWFICESGKAVREDHMSLLSAFLVSKAAAGVQGDSIAKERAAELEAKADILLEEVQAKQTGLDSAMAQHEEQARGWVAQLDAVSSALEAKISAVAEREAACAAKEDTLKQQMEVQAAMAADLQLQAQSTELATARRRLMEEKTALQQRADAAAAEESAAKATKEEMEASAAALQLREAEAEAQSVKLATAKRRLEEEKMALQQRAEAVTAKESAAKAAKKEAEAKEKEKEATAKKKAEAQSVKLATARRRLMEEKTALQQRADAVAAEESAAKAAGDEVKASAAAWKLREAMIQESEIAIKEQEARAAQLLKEAQAERAAAGRVHAAAKERASADLRQQLDALASAQQQEITRLEEARAEVDSTQAQLVALRTEICANKAEAQQVNTTLATPPGLAAPKAAAAEQASVQQATAQAAKPMQTRPQPQRMQQVKSASTAALLPDNGAPPPMSAIAAPSGASAAAPAPPTCQKTNQQDRTASKITSEKVVTTCAPPPSFAEPKTAAAKQAPCQQAADQAADFTWLGIKLKSSQTPERQAQRTQQVDDSASKAALLPTKMAPPPSSAAAPSAGAPAAAPAPLAGKKADQKNGITKKATIAEVVMCASPPGLAVPKGAAAEHAIAQQTAAQAAKPMQTRPQPRHMPQVMMCAPPPGFAQPKAAAANQASAQQAAPQAGKPEQTQRQAQLMPQVTTRAPPPGFAQPKAEQTCQRNPDTSKLRQEASQAEPPMAPQLSKGQDNQASTISSRTATSAEQTEAKAMPEHMEGDDRKEHKERPAAKGRKARQGAKKRAERAAQAASIPGAAPLRPDSSATAMAGRVQLKAATAVRPWSQQRTYHATPAEARMVQSLTLGLENGGGLFNPEGCDMATRAGHNACFANASMQVLYHTAPPALRAFLIALHPASIQDPVVRELQQLFVAMADGGRPSADTRGLRKALHDADGKKFELGCPCSASDIMPLLLDRLHEEPACRSAVQRVFGCKAAHSCATCGKRFDPRDAWQLYCQSSAVPASADTGLEASLAPLLRQTLSCYPCCGQTMQPTLVSGQPQVMVATLGFNAEAGGAGTEQAGVHDLASIISNLKTLRQALDLGGIYRGIEGGAKTYRLQGLVCHHSSKHYVSYVRLQEVWIRLDDTKVTIVGTLEHVMDECCSHRMQPEVAAFEAM